MRIEWKLRLAAAQRGVWTGTQLRRLLQDKAGLDMSSASVSALFTKEPSQIRLTTLLAICTALQCSPSDLFDIDITPILKTEAPQQLPAPAKAASAGRGRSMPPL